MASFTDSLQPYSPYVQQLPVEAYLNVGLQKQAQYNQGIEKIQSQIDNIAGLDIIRDVDKQYLQSKLNQLGGDLKKVAAGDFSNYQLTNSVGGMIGKIGKDPNIQNAVFSTQKVRKGQQDMEAARKAGKSAPENEAWWNDQVNSWMTNPNIGDKFEGSFIEYRDVGAKLTSIADKIHEIDNSIDIPYQRDASGNILTDKNGKPLVDDAMLRIKTKGKPAEKLLSAFYTTLDENDKRQLMITGNYHYRGATKDVFKSDIQSNYNENKKILSDALVNLNLNLQTNPKLTSVKKSEIQAKINEINNKLTNGSLESQLYKDLSSIDNITNLSEYKYKLYTQKYLTNLAKDLSYQSYQQEILSNPYSQMGMEKARLQFQYDNANRQQRNWEADFQWKQTEFFAKQKKEAAGIPVTPGRLSTDVAPPTLNDISNDITDILGDKKTGKIGQIQILNNMYSPLISDSTLTTPEQKKAYLDGLSAQYSKDPSTLTTIKDPNIKEYLEKRRALEIQAAQKQALYNATVEASKQFDDTLANIYKGEKGILDSFGREIYTATELGDIKSSLATRFTEFTKFPFPTSRAGTIPTPKTNIEGFLNEYRGTKMEPVAIAFAKQEQGLPLSSDERKVINRANELGYELGPKRMSVSEAKFKFQSNYLAQRMPERQTQIGTLNVNNSKPDDRVDEAAVEQLLGAKLVEYEQAGQVDSEKAAKFDPAVIAKFKKDKEATYTLEKRYDGSASLVIASGGETQTVPMTADEFSTFFPNYTRTNPIEDIKYAILGSPNKTTNISGNKGDGVNAYITGYSLPGIANTALAPIVRVDVEGSPFNIGDNKDKYVVRMYVNDNGIWKSDVITQNGYINESEMQTVLQSIGTKTVDDLLKKNKK